MKLKTCRFLWVSLQIDNLCDSRRIKVEGDLVDELARLPRNLADMYARILENIARIKRRGRTVAETVLKWLMCTQDARSHVAIAAASEKGSTEHRHLSIPDILDVCSTLVVYDKALDRFRFAHLSIREFLESQPGYTPSEANRSFVERSLQTLMSNQSPEDPFWLYATYNWGFHYGRLEEPQRKEVFELHAKRFLFDGAESSESFNTWATAYRWCYGWTRWDTRTANMFHSSTLEPDSEIYDSDSSEPVSFAPLDWEDHLHSWTLNPVRVAHSWEVVLTSPMMLASSYGWLEILDHFEASHSPDDLQALAMGMMDLAIRSG